MNLALTTMNCMLKGLEISITPSPPPPLSHKQTTFTSVPGVLHHQHGEKNVGGTVDAFLCALLVFG
jgi:hypothetical protein